MAETLPVFDSLAQGMGYASAPAPTTDALPTSDIAGSQHVNGSSNDSMTPDAVSLATKKEDAPMNGTFHPSRLHEDFWLNVDKPIY